MDVYRKTLALAHTAWWSTAGIVVLRAFEIIPQQFGLAALLTLGGGVTASLALSRMRLSDTVTGAFKIGLQSAISLSANVFTDTCIMSLDDDGRVLGVDHADAIGWSAQELKGRELRALLSPRSHGVRELVPGSSVTSPMLNQKGETFDARLSFAALDEGVMIVTVSPVIAINSEGNYRK